jgi:vacuolar-type H+-ATPase subunit I/STV1
MERFYHIIAVGRAHLVRWITMLAVMAGYVGQLNKPWTEFNHLDVAVCLNVHMFALLAVGMQYIRDWRADLDEQGVKQQKRAADFERKDQELAEIVNQLRKCKDNLSAEVEKQSLELDAERARMKEEAQRILDEARREREIASRDRELARLNRQEAEEYARDIEDAVDPSNLRHRLASRPRRKARQVKRRWNSKTLVLA